MPIEDYNPVFDEPTPPRAKDADGNGRAGVEKPAEPPVSAAKPKRSAKRAAARTDAEEHASAPSWERTFAQAHPKAEMSAAEERRILHGVRAALGKVARDQASLRESEEIAAREVAEARASGIDERKLLGAALSAGVDLPAAE